MPDTPIIGNDILTARLEWVGNYLQRPFLRLTAPDGSWIGSVERITIRRNGERFNWIAYAGPGRTKTLGSRSSGYTNPTNAVAAVLRHHGMSTDDARSLGRELAEAFLVEFSR